MKHVGNELNNILSSRRIKKKTFAQTIGMTDVNLSKVLKKDSIDAELLEKISLALRVPISFWFDDKMTLSKISLSMDDKDKELLSELEQRDSEIDFLKVLLSEKERTIQILMQKSEFGNSQIAADPSGYLNK